MLTRCLGLNIKRQPQCSAVSVPGTSEEFSIGKWGRDDRRFELKGHKLARRIIARRRLIFWLEIANMDVVSFDCKCMHYAEF
jgi:hypothetical protein